MRPFSPERRSETLKAVADYAMERGISREVLEGVETAQEVAFLFNAMKNEQEVKDLKLQLAGKSQKLREANRARQGSQAGPACLSGRCERRQTRNDAAGSDGHPLSTG